MLWIAERCDEIWEVGQASPRYRRLLEILLTIGEVAYELALPPAALHPIFHVLMMHWLVPLGVYCLAGRLPELTLASKASALGGYCLARWPYYWVLMVRGGYLGLEARITLIGSGFILLHAYVYLSGLVPATSGDRLCNINFQIGGEGEHLEA
ncbi:hypothetical protein MTR67_024025 [Solanum verrucosum]|uniref:Tf2-1-like SH3-like domain-containing protein n=1 Tax=Solanum verrucosum TaxID=315347 RepID=A0AAF0TY52_SOLVR|nr:hypothetical protein MTR67_024025 [Solanum verrucosum]